MTLHVRLFGEFRVDAGEGTPAIVLESRKAEELLCYMLLFGERVHSREAIADLLWGERASIRAKKYLRHALWQLQSSLAEVDATLLLADSDSIRLSPQAEMWLDVSVFEHASRLGQNAAPEAFTPVELETLKEAIALYQGELLAHRDWSWCYHERERLQALFFGMLDQLMAHAEVEGAYEQGLDYGAQVLRIDGARESTHRRMIRLYYRKGDRTGALRQYQRCTFALAEEFGVKPSRRTTALYQRIRNDALDVEDRADGFGDRLLEAQAEAPLPDMLLHLQSLDDTLDALHMQVQREIRALRMALHRQK